MADATVTPAAVAATSTLPTPDVALSYNAVNMMSVYGTYGLPGVALIRASSAVNVDRLTNVMYYSPIRVKEPINITEIGIYVTGAAAATNVGIVGIYAADLNLEPDGGPINTSPIEFPIDATGAVPSDPLDIDLAVGTYLVSWQCSALVDLRYALGVIPDVLGFSSTFDAAGGKLQVSRTWDGTNPDPGPAATSSAAGDAEMGFEYIFGIEYTIL